jgi:hypothetical protein
MFEQTAEDLTYYLYQSLEISSMEITSDKELPYLKFRNGEVFRAWKKAYQLQ